MKLSIFGTGYVGLVSGACLAEVGHNVVCMDVDQVKIDKLKAGILPIWEPGLEALVERNVKEGRLSFTTDAAHAVQHGQVQFIAVGTPPDENGSADMQYVLAVAKSIATHMTDYRLIVSKSTVPVGTADQVAATITQELQTRCPEFFGVTPSPRMPHTPTFDVVSNPEFLKEGAAVDDFLKPDRIIIGTASEKAKAIMRELYGPFNRSNDRTLFMDVRSAELTKYAANAMLATKISFMNEMANLAERLGADIEEVRKGIGADPRIGYQFIYPGCGYGGSCIPKDVQALARTAHEYDQTLRVLEAVEAVNHDQKHVLVKKVLAKYGRNLAGKTFALWGLAFKPNTNDMREAPSRVIVQALLRAGARIVAHDPVAAEEARRVLALDLADAPVLLQNLQFADKQMQAVQGADALIIVTEWKAYRSPNWTALKAAMKTPVIFDGRNLYEPQAMREIGIDYVAIGRGNHS